MIESCQKGIFVGTSAGGISALHDFFSFLGDDFFLPLTIVQHFPERAQIQPSMIFGRDLKNKILEVEDQVSLEPQKVFFSTPGYHLLLNEDRSFSLSQDEPVHHCRPSIDVFFESVASAMGENACGVLLTGANSDGAIGLRCIKEEGGLTIVQNPDSAEYPMMPKSALDEFTPDFIGDIQSIAARVLQFQNSGTI